MRYSHLIFRIYSVIVGFISSIYIPKRIRKTVFCFIGKKLLGMNDNDYLEMAKPLESYRNIDEFFTRPIDMTRRPLSSKAIVSPCDGTLIDSGKVSEGVFTTVKGHKYGILQLTKDSKISRMFKNASFYNIYLSPRNYHRLHCPCSGTVKEVSHIEGFSLPVNDWGQKIKGLYALNERYIINIESSDLKLLLVAVGAAAVSKIEISVIKGQVVNKGDLLGIFHMGSSVVLFHDSHSGKSKMSPGKEVRVLSPFI